MPRNGSGGYTPPLNSWNPPINGAAAQPADWQAILSDLATAIQASIAADGQTPITGVLNFSNNRISGVGSPIGQGNALRWEQLTKGANIASAATIDIPNEGNLFEITGTTTIAGITDTYPGRTVFLKFQGALTLTNSANLVMPGAVDVHTRSGDIAIIVNVENAVWQCVYFSGAKDVSAASLNGGQLAGFRNKILNGRFNINQAGAASRTAVANEYNFDQWYYDGTYLYQPIPTEDVYDGTYTLSWEGNSTAAWSLNATNSAGQGSQTYTPVDNGGQIVVSGKTNQHLWVRFATDLANLDKVQLEPGSVATSYEDRFYSQELVLCQWFYEQSYNLGTQPGTPNANAGKQLFGTNLSAGTVDLVVFNVCLSPKRIVPTVTVWSPASGIAGRVRNESAGEDDTDIGVLGSTSGFSLQAYPLDAASALTVSFQWTASARI